MWLKQRLLNLGLGQWLWLWLWQLLGQWLGQLLWLLRCWHNLLCLLLGWLDVDAEFLRKTAVNKLKALWRYEQAHSVLVTYLFDLIEHLGILIEEYIALAQ